MYRQDRPVESWWSSRSISFDQLLSMIDYGELGAKNNCQTSAIARQKAKRERFFLLASCVYMLRDCVVVAFLNPSSYCFYFLRLAWSGTVVTSRERRAPRVERRKSRVAARPRPRRAGTPTGHPARPSSRWGARIRRAAPTAAALPVAWSAPFFRAAAADEPRRSRDASTDGSRPWAARTVPNETRNRPRCPKRRPGCAPRRRPSPS